MYLLRAICFHAMINSRYKNFYILFNSCHCVECIFNESQRSRGYTCYVRTVEFKKLCQGWNLFQTFFLCNFSFAYLTNFALNKKQIAYSWIINKNTDEQEWQDQSLWKLGLIYIRSENYIIIRYVDKM